MTIKSTIRGCKRAVWSCLFHKRSSLEERGGFPYTLYSRMTVWEPPNDLCSHYRRVAVTHRVPLLAVERFLIGILSYQCLTSFFFVCVIICNCKGQSLQAQTDVTDYAWAHIDSRTLTMAEVCPLHSKNIVLKPVSEPPPVPRRGVVPQCGGRPLGCYLTRSSAGRENRPKEGLEWRGMW